MSPLRLLLALALINWLSLLPPLYAQELDLGEDGLEAEDEVSLESELGIEEAEWWDKEWQYRRKMALEGSGLLSPKGGVIFLDEPDPLLLCNTGRCQRALADVRVLTWDGDVLPSGVTNFGADDGSSRLWFRTGKPAGGTKLTLYLYYGNPRAKGVPRELPADAEPHKPGALLVRSFPEKIAPGAEPPKPPETGEFFRGKIFLEAEDSLDPDGKRSGIKKLRRRDGQASNGACLRLASEKEAAPIVLHHTVKLPEPGRWLLHVRHLRGREPTPFSVRVANASAQCGRTSSDKPAFGWETHRLDLPAGEHKLTIHAESAAAAEPDCLLLTQDAAYLPDYRDFNGPVQMRFRLKNEEVQPYHINFFNWNVTYSTMGMQGETSCWLLKDRKVENAKLAKELAAKPENLIADSSWTPWGKALPSGSWTWFCEIRFLGAGRELDVEFQFATRPDPSRVFRDGLENTGLVASLCVHMPASVHWKHVHGMTTSFGQWGRQRFEMAKSMGFKEGEGPKTIVAGTMAGARSLEEARYIFKTCSWLGLNIISLSLTGARSSDILEPLFEESGLPWFWDHAWVYSRGNAVGVKPDPRKSYRENVSADLAAKGDSYYRSLIEGYRKHHESRTRRTRYNIMGDEIGAFTSFEAIDKSPQQHGFFVEYLQEHGLTPDHFGYERWEDMRAFGYAAALTKEQQKKVETEKAVQATEAAIQKAAEGNDLEDIDEPDEAETADDVENEIQRAQEEEARKAAEKLAKPDPLQEDKYRNRAWYWTQRFRSHYTALLLHHYSAGMHKHFPAGVNGGPNLQAMPVQVGRMWDGELNIFDLGRENAVDTLQVEDWWGGPHNVAYAMNLQRAAARKHKQQLAALLVGGGPGPRIMSNLMEGCRFFLFYLYGPIYCIGPVWAEDPGTYRQIGESMRQIARCEEDILAASPRPRDAALLVANTSEINAAFFPYPIGRQRISIYAALKDSQVPVDVVGEEEILEDDALTRYRILYVSDPHVRSPVQQKIKQWVAEGGTLWADYAGLARQEYGERSTLMDEVFGLKDRGEVEPFVIGGRGWGCYGSISTPEGHGLKIPRSEFFEPDDIKGLHTSSGLRGLFYRPKYELSSGRALARFDDDSAAIVHNRFGKGQAFLFGFQAGFAYTGCRGNWTHALPFKEPSTPLRAQLMTAPARAAGVRKHLTIQRHFVQTAVHDGPRQTVVYLNNLGPEIEGLPMTVSLPSRPVSVFSSRARKVDLQYEAPHATVTIDLPAWKGKILVFRLSGKPR